MPGEPFRAARHVPVLKTLLPDRMPFFLGPSAFPIFAIKTALKSRRISECGRCFSSLPASVQSKPIRLRRSVSLRPNRISARMIKPVEAPIRDSLSVLPTSMESIGTRSMKVRSCSL